MRPTMSEAKEKVRVYAVACGCTIREERGLCWKTPVWDFGVDRFDSTQRKIEFISRYGDKVAVRDSKKGIVCL